MYVSIRITVVVNSVSSLVHVFSDYPIRRVYYVCVGCRPLGEPAHLDGVGQLRSGLLIRCNVVSYDTLQYGTAQYNTQPTNMT